MYSFFPKINDIADEMAISRFRILPINISITITILDSICAQELCCVIVISSVITDTAVSCNKYLISKANRCYTISTTGNINNLILRSWVALARKCVQRTLKFETTPDSFWSAQPQFGIQRLAKLCSICKIHHVIQKWKHILLCLLFISVVVLNSSASERAKQFWSLSLCARKSINVFLVNLQLLFSCAAKRSASLCCLVCCV